MSRCFGSNIVGEAVTICIRNRRCRLRCANWMLRKKLMCSALPPPRQKKNNNLNFGVELPGFPQFFFVDEKSQEVFQSTGSHSHGSIYHKPSQAPFRHSLSNILQPGISTWYNFMFMNHKHPYPNIPQILNHLSFWRKSFHICGICVFFSNFLRSFHPNWAIYSDRGRLKR